MRLYSLSLFFLPPTYCQQLCLSQRCVSVTMLGISPCIVGANGQICSGNGVCNNLDQCSCNVGYNGTACEERVRNGNTKSSSSRGEWARMESVGSVCCQVCSLVSIASLRRKKIIDLMYM